MGRRRPTAPGSPRRRCAAPRDDDGRPSSRGAYDDGPPSSRGAQRRGDPGVERASLGASIKWTWPGPTAPGSPRRRCAAPRDDDGPPSSRRAKRRGDPGVGGAEPRRFHQTDDSTDARAPRPLGRRVAAPRLLAMTMGRRRPAAPGSPRRRSAAPRDDDEPLSSEARSAVAIQRRRRGLRPCQRLPNRRLRNPLFGRSARLPGPRAAPSAARFSRTVAVFG